MSGVPQPRIDVGDPEVVAATNASPPLMASPITNKRKRTPLNLPLHCIHCDDRDLGDLKVNSETMLVSCSSCDQDSPFNLYDAAQLASCLTGSNDMKMGTSAYAAKSEYMSTIVAMQEASNASTVLNNQHDENL